MLLKTNILFLLCTCFFSGYCQQSDTLKIVDVIAEKDSILRITIINSNVPHYIISKERLDELIAEDIGDALKYIPGTFIKDYGGIGGLKTISYRSLGASHTAVSVDGVVLPNTQTATVDLNNFNIFGTQSIEMTSGQVQNPYSSASTYLKSNVLSLNTILFSENISNVELKVIGLGTTINAFQNGILFRQNINKKLSYGLQGLYTYGNGAYQFKLKNVDSVYTAERQNANLNQLKVKGGIRYKHKNFKLFWSGSFKRNNQELPGAVVLYNPFNDQNIFDQTVNSVLNIQISQPRFAIGFNAFAQENETIYTDHLFQNAEGILVNNYINQSAGTGFILNRFLSTKKQRLFIGSDYKVASLTGNQFNTSPVRQNIISVLGISKWLGRIKLQGNITHQFIQDKSIDSTLSFSHFSPFISFAVLPFKKQNFRIRAHYKNTYRLPSFNDLYYNFIGNSNLKAENANTGNLGFTFGKEWSNNLLMETTIDVYNSNIDNKIVAIPTKNLFNWSMQNIGKSQSFGSELNILLSKKTGAFKYTFSISQAFNSSIDITDPDSPTYRHQLPYTPVYTAGYSLGFDYKTIQTNVNILHSGARYTLNENISFNRLEGFIDVGIGAGKLFKINKKQSLKLNIQMTNLLNNNYEVIRSFPMPGRHFKFRFEYNFNL